MPKRAVRGKGEIKFRLEAVTKYHLEVATC